MKVFQNSKNYRVTAAAVAAPITKRDRVVELHHINLTETNIFSKGELSYGEKSAHDYLYL